MQRLFRAIHEPKPGAKWQGLFRALWKDYHRWFLKEGEAKRPRYATSVKKLREYMPELLPTYEALSELAGGSDHAARFLSLYCPTPYLTGCTQAAWAGKDPVLIRNYDYSPELWEAICLSTAWHGRRVIAMSDCLWGVLDGMNEAGLSVSLSFGGRKIVGEGFGIPLVLRYILEFCHTTREAAAVLERIPVHMSYNVTVLDRHGHSLTAYTSPDRPTVIRRWPIATNHQERVDWPQYAAATSSLEREKFLAACFSDPAETSDSLAGRFLQAPLYIRGGRHWRTLYTALYRPREGEVEYRWPDQSLRQSFDRFHEGQILVGYS